MTRESGLGPTRLAPVLVAVLSAAVVWSAFDALPHTGGDNAGYVSLAYGLLTTGSYVEVFDPAGLPHTKYPPVFPLLLAGMIALGARTWVALKLSASVPTVAAAVLVFLWGRARIGSLGGLAISTLFAVSAGVVYYSHWILSDPLFVAWTLAALYCLDRSDGVARAGGGDRAAPGTSSADTSSENPTSTRSATLWLAAGVVATGLAYFTRSAGLPLVVAVLAWLAWARRWRALVASSAALGLPMAAWWLRSRGEGVAQYATEFWMVDPYQPSLGTVGVGGLVSRVGENLSAYVLRHGPAGVVGADGPALSALGVGLTLAAVVGWVLVARRRIGPAELFFPLYAGLILLWPQVWGGDRFALPLYPLVFLYGAVALATVSAKLPGAARGALAAAALLVLLLPAGGSWLRTAERARACVPVARENGPWACYGPRVDAFFEAATWTTRGLPADASVLSRKPRHFYASSGHPSRAFPFDDDPTVLLALADDLGTRYVLLDQWDGLASRYVGGAVRRMPGAFCWVRGFGSAEGSAQLLGILPPASRSGGPAAGEEVSIAPCPADYVSDDTASASRYSSSGRIPLLERLGS